MRRTTFALALAVGAALALGAWADASPRRRPCPGLLKPCGEECYDPFLQTCQPGRVCPAGQKSCAGNCYDPRYQVCHPGGTVCAGGQRPCGEECYDPVTQECQHRPVDRGPPEGE